MAFKIEKLKTDNDKEVNGVWMDYLGGSRLLIARLNNKAAEAERMRLAKENSLMLQNDTENKSDLFEKLETEVLASSVLLGWEGVEDLDDNPLEATVENRLKFLTEIKDFRDDVIRLASERDRYKANSDAEDAEAVKQ